MPDNPVAQAERARERLAAALGLPVTESLDDLVTAAVTVIGEQEGTIERLRSERVDAIRGSRYADVPLPGGNHG
jgi:hypothetical protein